MPNTSFKTDIKRIAKILRAGGYDYDQSKYLIAEARKLVGLKRPRNRSGSVARLSNDEIERFLGAAYNISGTRGLLLRTLLETGSRVSAFCRMEVEQISFAELEIRFPSDKGDKAREVPILRSLANELRLHLGSRQTGYVFPSPRGGAYSSRTIQRLVKRVAEEAGITKNVYPHLLRHTIAQRLADNGMPENVLQQFLGHTNPQTTQVYYETKRPFVRHAFNEAMRKP